MRESWWCLVHPRPSLSPADSLTVHRPHEATGRLANRVHSPCPLAWTAFPSRATLGGRSREASLPVFPSHSQVGHLFFWGSQFIVLMFNDYGPPEWQKFILPYVQVEIGWLGIFLIFVKS